MKIMNPNFDCSSARYALTVHRRVVGRNPTAMRIYMVHPMELRTKVRVTYKIHEITFGYRSACIVLEMPDIGLQEERRR